MNRLVKIQILFLVAAIMMPGALFGQLYTKSRTGELKVDYASPKQYELGGIIVTGTKILDPNALILLTGLKVGDRINIPGDRIATAIRNLWKQGLFSDIAVYVSKVEGNKVYLEFEIREQPRLSRFKLNGVSKGEADKIREAINLYRERVITDNVLVTTRNKIKSYFVEKGFYYATSEIIQKEDSLYPNHIMLIINIDKKKRVKIEDIVFHGNKSIPSKKLKKVMKETRERARFEPLANLPGLVKNLAVAAWKQKNDTVLDILREYSDQHIRLHLFKASKFIRSNYKVDKEQLAVAYKSEGYRDFKILSDTLRKLDDRNLRIDIYVEEGKQYFFRNIYWVGNSKFSTEELSNILGIEKGDVYDQSLLEQRLYMNPSGLDISSKYMDDGYLFFQVTPVEVNVEDDSIDIEIRIYEGEQARVNKVLISGNTKTNEHVIRREIRTKPGDLFSRTDIMRTQRELSILGFFDPEKMNVVPKPNPIDGTVDIEYVVAEKPSDQVELSGGYGGGQLLGTIGLTFSNFSTRNLFKKDAWTPLPAGDGQRLSIRAQTSGPQFYTFNFSFTEPWLGGRRPNAFTFTTYYTGQSNDEKKYAFTDTGEKIPNPLRRSLGIFGVSVGLGKRLTWPDDNFQLYQELAYQYYDVRQWPAFQGFNEGFANNLFYRVVFTRSSLDDLNFPKSGSRVTLSAQFTPPYSWFNGKDYTKLSTEEKFHFVEYHKWKFTAAWYNNFVDKFVVYAKVGFGGLFQYSPDVGTAPFERFYLGGSGLTGFSLDAREIIALRGYDDNSLSPQVGAPLVTKYTMEVRYPFSTNPNAMIYGLVFAEMGNTWESFKTFSPFNNYRSAGVGIRVFLPMFGLLGLDWGYRFDDVATRPGMRQSQLHFTIGANLGEL